MEVKRMADARAVAKIRISAHMGNYITESCESILIVVTPSDSFLMDKGN